jgi:hypothetical protein
MTEEIILTNDESIDYCLICWLNKSKIVLCSKCKYKYCMECAKKLNNTCAICIRTREINRYNDEHLIEYDIGIIYEPDITYFIILTKNIIISIIFGCCWLAVSCLFGYIGIIFLIKYLRKLFIFIICKIIKIV